MTRRARIVCLLLMALTACRRSVDPAAKDGHENWAVTLWGSDFEIFAEVEPLVAGQKASSNTHVTVLRDFSPLREGTVAVLLKSPGGEPLVFEQKQRKRDGIYVIEVTPPREGIFDLAFRIESPHGREEIAGGRVRVGSKASPGGLLEEAGSAGESEAQAISFLKEQQWRTEFGTALAREGAVKETLEGPARVRAAAGGEISLSAPVEAVVASRPWPYVGQDLARGDTVFALIPRVAAERSLSELRAEVAAIEAETGAARSRTERLEKLLQVEAVSRAEFERTAAALAGLEAHLEAAKRDLENANAARTGQAGAPSLFVRAPWPGRVAEVTASPGQAVEPGVSLGRIVKHRPLWVEIALRPEDAARLSGEKAHALLIRRAGKAEPMLISGSEVRLISRSPEIDPKTSSVSVLLEIDRSVAEIPIGTAAEAELLLSGERRGVVVPVSSLVDDGGVTVVYEQLEGESFARREVRVRQRQGSQALIEGLRPGARVATRGAAAIRRASLLSSGAPEGHVH